MGRRSRRSLPRHYHPGQTVRVFDAGLADVPAYAVHAAAAGLGCYETTSLMTFPRTSVSRMSRPPKRKVNFS